MTVASAINALKANSSRWMHDHNKAFDWQKGYGAFSVSPSQTEAVKEYIRTQGEHHAKHTFEDEFISLLKKCGVSLRSQIRVWLACPPLALGVVSLRSPTATAVG